MHMYLHGFPLSLSLCRVPQGGCPCRGPKRSVIWRRRTIGLRDVFPVLRGDNYRTVTPRRCPAVAPLSLTATSRYRPACDRSDTGPERAGKGRAAAERRRPRLPGNARPSRPFWDVTQRVSYSRKESLPLPPQQMNCKCGTLTLKPFLDVFVGLSRRRVESLCRQMNNNILAADRFGTSRGGQLFPVV